MNVGVTGWDVDLLIKEATLRKADHIGLLFRIDGTHGAQYLPGIWEYKDGDNPYYNENYVKSMVSDIIKVRQAGFRVVLRMTMWKNPEPTMAATLHDMFTGTGIRTREGFGEVIVNVLNETSQYIDAISPFSEFGFWPYCTNQSLPLQEQIEEGIQRWYDCWQCWMPIIRSSFPDIPVILSTPTYDESTGYTSSYPMLPYEKQWGRCIASVHHYKPRPYLENWGEFAWNMPYNKQKSVAAKSTIGPPDLLWHVDNDFDGLPWNKQGLAIAIGSVKQWGLRHGIQTYVEELGEAKSGLKYSKQYNSDVKYVCNELRVPYAWWIN